MKKIMSLLLALVMVLALLAGCGSKPSNDGQGGAPGTRDSLTVAVTAEP